MRPRKKVTQSEVFRHRRDGRRSRALPFSTLIFERWSFAGAGRIAHMNSRIAGDPSFKAHNPYGSSFFSLPPIASMAILAAFLAAAMGGTHVLLKRRDRF